MPEPILCANEIGQDEATSIPLFSVLADSSEASIREPYVDGHLIPLEKFSKFSFLKNVMVYVHRFLNNIRRKIVQKNPNRNVRLLNDEDLQIFVTNKIISNEQHNLFPDVYTYCDTVTPTFAEVPELVTKFNLYKDEHDVIRVKSKFPRNKETNPILLSKDSLLSKLLILDAHNKLSHSGIYQTIRELRRQFHIICFFTAVKKVLNSCITCRKINRHPIKLNQSEYRSFRMDPPTKPFSSVYMDYIGPFTICLAGERKKVWLLAITCLFSRALNLKVCQSANLSDFLRAVQLHCFEFGIFQSFTSDLGSQLQAGASMLYSFLNDFETKQYFEENGMRLINFQHYAKGNSALGSLIESLVKQVKYLIFKSIRNLVLDFFEFDYLVQKAVCLINKRPIAFKDGLRSEDQDYVPVPITPEMVLRGYETIGVNVIPPLQPILDEFVSNPNSVSDAYEKLRKARERLLETYRNEFIGTLLDQAVDKNSRYKTVKHDALQVGDIVMLVDPLAKQYNYNIGRVLNVESNSLGEVTAAHILKGKSREKVYRHVTSLILLLRPASNPLPALATQPQIVPVEQNSVRRNPGRSAARECRSKLRQLRSDDAI